MRTKRMRTKRMRTKKMRTSRAPAQRAPSLDEIIARHRSHSRQVLVGLHVDHVESKGRCIDAHDFLGKFGSSRTPLREPLFYVSLPPRAVFQLHCLLYRATSILLHCHSAVLQTLILHIHSGSHVARAHQSIHQAVFTAVRTSHVLTVQQVTHVRFRSRAHQHHYQSVSQPSQYLHRQRHFYIHLTCLARSRDYDPRAHPVVNKYSSRL